MWALPLTLLLLHQDAFGLFIGETRTDHGLHIPIHRTVTPDIQKRAVVGLGNYFDVTYNVLLDIGNTPVPLILDTGSSDLWVASDACTSSECRTTTNLQKYPQSSFKSTGLTVNLAYGDSFTGTHASGLIGKDGASLGGLGLQDQYFGAINDTNTTVLKTGSLGIFGTGFPLNSAIWFELFDASSSATSARASTRRELPDYGRRIFPDLSNLNHGRASLPSISGLIDRVSSGNPQARQTTTSSSRASAIAQQAMSSWSTYGTLMTRLIESMKLTPMFTVALQRNTIDVGGNAGLMSIGELPSGISNGTLTWVPLRAYSSSDGGLVGPPDSPQEQYPFAWEVFIDDVYFDGEKIPRSTLAASDISLSALVDTGNSLIRGPSDNVQWLVQKLGGSTFSCSTPHTLAFQIGGKMFPVDPRDFISQTFQNNANTCNMNVVVTDTPTRGGSYLNSWSLGDPFLKSVLSSYYYGNLTHPSLDPPRMGFLSTVPSDADNQYRTAYQAARSSGNFPALQEAAPSTVPSFTRNSLGVPEASSSSTGRGKNNSASEPQTSLLSLLAMVSMFYAVWL